MNARDDVRLVCDSEGAVVGFIWDRGGFGFYGFVGEPDGSDKRHVAVTDTAEHCEKRIWESL